MMTLDEVRAFFAEDFFALDTCGITIDAVGDGTADCSMKLEQKHLNANRVAQGGALFTLCDICMSVAANAGGVMTVTQNMNIHYLRPGTGACLYARAERISEGRTTCLYRVDVRDENEKLVAYATGTGFRKAAVKSM